MPGTDLKNPGKLEVKVSKTRCERGRCDGTLRDIVLGIACLLVGGVAEMLLMVHFHTQNIVYGNCVVAYSHCKGNLNRVNGLLTLY